MTNCNGLLSSVVFDLDGTLVDSKELMRHSYYAACKEVIGTNAAPPFSEYCRYLGQGFPNIMRQMGLPLEMYQVFKRESAQNINRLRMFDQVPQVLEELARRSVTMAIATGKDHARAVAVLEHLGISHYFSIVLGCDDVPKQKPAPDMAFQIMDVLELTPGRTLFVGDAVADLECGQRAGMITGFALWDQPADEVMAHPCDFRLAQPSEILALVGR